VKHVVTVALVIVAIIHLLPLPGVLGAKRLEALYGISVAERNIEILMRHRAAMFGSFGAFILVAAFCVALQPAAFALGFASVISFLWLARSVGGYNARVGRVFAADVVALISLVVGVGTYVTQRVL
jgi:hypothetical protein